MSLHRFDETRDTKAQMTDFARPAPRLEWRDDGTRLILVATGEWTIETIGAMEGRVAEAGRAIGDREAVIDISAVAPIDTSGAYLFDQIIALATAGGGTTTVKTDDPRHRTLLATVDHRSRTTPTPRVPPPLWRHALETLGRWGYAVARDGGDILRLLGEVMAVIGRGVLKPSRLRWTSVVHHLDRTGWGAVPVVALMSFLIGAIIAQQGAFYFRRFGADLYVVDMVGVLVLREIGVLLTAIMVAGRSGSAFTAELGAMKMREEIDAMRVIGLNPIEVLVAPRVIALVIALPCLAFIADMAAIAGGALVSVIYVGIPLETFLQRLNEGVYVRTFLVGIAKAPFMALIIAVVACMEGMKVEGSTDSLGRHTTEAVVKSIFLVIVVDGLFAMFYAAAAL